MVGTDCQAVRKENARLSHALGVASKSVYHAKSVFQPYQERSVPFRGDKRNASRPCLPVRLTQTGVMRSGIFVVRRAQTGVTRPVE